LGESSRRHGISMLIQGSRGVFFTVFIDREIAHSIRDLKEADQERQMKFRSLLLEEGVLILHRGRWYISGALTDGDIDRTLECTDRVMGELL